MKIRYILSVCVLVLSFWGLACRTTPDAPPPKPDPVFNESRLEVKEQALSSFTVETITTIQNPREEDLVFSRVSYTLLGRGHKIAEGDDALSVTVPPLSNLEIKVPVKVEHSLGESDEKEIFSGDAVPLVFRGVFHGQYGSEKVEMNLDRAGRLRTPRLPSISLGTPDGARRRVDVVHATFRLQAGNDNPFDVRLSSLDYVLEVEGNVLREARVGTGQRLPPSGAYVFLIEQDLNADNVPELLEKMTEENAVSYRIYGNMKLGEISIDFDESDQIRFAGQ